MKISVDRLVYFCNRGGDSIQVFTTRGKFVKEFFLYRSTRVVASGSSMVTFSHDPQQKYLFVSDRRNGVVWILRRADGVIVGSVGRKGRMAGELYVPNGIAVDSKGNLYVGEVDTQALACVSAGLRRCPVGLRGLRYDWRGLNGPGGAR